MLPTRLAALPLGLLLCAAALTAQTTHTWQGGFIADWSSAGNWSTYQIPDAPDDTVVFDNPDSPFADYQIASPYPSAIIGHIRVSNAAATGAVILGAGSDATSSIALGAATTGPPSISVTSGTLSIHGVLAGTQGFVKTGAGVLSFRDSPYLQLFTGPVALGGGTLVVGANHHLGYDDNDLFVTASSTLLADPPVASTPVVLGRDRSIDAPSGSPTLTVGNASDSGTLELAGQLSGDGTLRFNGVGTLVLSGTSTRTGSLNYQLRPLSTLTSVTRASELHLLSYLAVPATGQSLVFDLGGANAYDTAIHARVDLGGLSRALRLSTAGRSNIHASSSILEIVNGELLSDGNGAELKLDAGGVDSTAELRLPASATLTRHSLRIGATGPGLAYATNTARVRIGSRAEFNLHSLDIGANGASGRLDALVPGSTLRLRGGNATGSLSTLTLGNFSSGAASRADAVLDLPDSVLDAQIGTLRLGSEAPVAPAYPTTAIFRFGSGTLEAGNVILGGGNSSAFAAFDYHVEQIGGDTRISGALVFSDSNAIGNISSRYILGGGTLALGQISAAGTFAGSLRPRLEWGAGTLRNYPGSDILVSGPSNPAVPFEILLYGPAPKSLHVDDGRLVTLPASVKLANITPAAPLVKTGAGHLILHAQTTGFTGTLRLGQGQLSLGVTPTTSALHAASFAWDTGTLRVPLFPPPTPSARLQLSGALIKTSAPASARVFTLVGDFAHATHTLATYTSTDLTVADFTVTGLPSGTSAEFTVGPTTLTVTFAPETAFTTWRRTKLASSSNLGPAHDLADPDSDGLPNLLEYALGSEPLESGAGILPVVSPTPSIPHSLQLTFPRIADPALTYTVRAANDPSGPWSGDGEEIIFTSTGTDNTEGPVTATDTAALSAHPRRFLRLTVSR